MPLIDEIVAMQEEMTTWRRDIHAHPELGFAENRTADFVASKLEEFGIEVFRGIGKTGVVGVLKVGNETRSVGLRADMDALPIHERNTFEHRSTNDVTRCSKISGKQSGFPWPGEFHLPTGRRRYWWRQSND